MKHLIRITDYSKEDIYNIYKIADEIQEGSFENALNRKTIVLFFPNTSIRTRVTFEKGIHLFGGQVILFPSDSLDKKEKMEDVVGYLNNWVDCIIVRHSDIDLINEIAKYSKVPVINAMTSINHPCEVLSDLYSLSKLRKDYLSLNYTFIGVNENIGKAWLEASKLLGFNLKQSCPKGYELDNISIEYDISKAMKNSDIILTDSISNVKNEFKDYHITKELMERANKGALINPCPPFTRGEEVSSCVIDSEYFVGYGFKKSLLYVQQAIILYNIYDSLLIK